MRRGFTLLEVLVASTVMAFAVVGLLSLINTSLRNASRVSDYDRAALIAKRKMDELLLDPKLPKLTVLEGVFDPNAGGSLQGGWRARVQPFEMPPNPGPNTWFLEQIQLEVWWMNGAARKTLAIEAFKRATLTGEDVQNGLVPK